MKSFTIAAALIATIALGAPLKRDEDDRQARQEFASYTAKFNKEYSGLGEYENKFRNFKHNSKFIKDTNKFADREQKHNPLSKPVRLTENIYTDCSTEDLIDQGVIGGFHPEMDDEDDDDRRLLQEETGSGVEGLPSILDLRDYMPQVRSQGGCGSCYAFCANVAFEGAAKYQLGVDFQASDQQLVSCDTANSGCAGGVMANSWRYQQRNPIYSGEDYPYTSGATWSTGECNLPTGASEIMYKPEYQNFRDRSIQQVKEALQEGPVVTAVGAAATPGFMSYSSGILYNVNTTSLDHAMVIVGYTPESWIIQNSWGEGWGDEGFMQISLDSNLRYFQKI